MSMLTDEMVEKAARALYLARDGINPDWPIGVDKNGYRQEPYVDHVPAWQWFYGKTARIALQAALSVRGEVVVTRNEEAGFVEFLDADRPTIVREIDGRVAILLDMETRGVIGYRVYEPAPATPPDLAERVRELEEALRPFAEACTELFNETCPDDIQAWEWEEADDEWRNSPVTVGDFRRAARAMEPDNG